MLKNHILGQASWLPFFEGENGGGGGGGGGTGTGTGAATTTGNGGGSARPGKSEAEYLAEIAAGRVALDTERGNSAALRTQLQTLEADVPKRIDAARKEEQNQTSKLRTRIINAELRVAASEAGLADNDLLGHSFFDTSKITVDAEGNVTGVRELFAEVKAKKPDWFKPPATTTTTTGAGATNGATRTTGAASPPPNGGTGAAPPTNVKDMKGPEYAEHRAGFLKSLRAAS